MPEPLDVPWMSETPAQTARDGRVSVVCRHIARWLLLYRSESLLIDTVSTLANAPITAHQILDLGTRASNILSQQFSDRDLRLLSPNMFLDRRSAGRSTVIEIISSIVAISVLSRFSQDNRESASLLDTPGEEFSERSSAGKNSFLALQLDPGRIAILEDLETLARWHVIRGKGRQHLFDQLDDDLVPAEVSAARGRILDIRASDMVKESDDTDAVSSIAAILATCDRRGMTILRDRLFARTPETLDALGRTFGVTRERIRQLETKAVGMLREQTSHGGPIGNFLAVLRAEIKSVLPLHRLTRRHPSLLREVPMLGEPLWFVLDRIDGAFEVKDGWAAAPTVDSSKLRTRQALEDLDNRHGLVRLAAVDEVLGSGMDVAELEAWLTYCGYTVMEGHVLIRNAVQDRAIAVLALEGHALSSAEIFARLADRTPGSIKNAMSLDSRVHRIDRDKWGLTEWGQESYTSIRDAIGRILDRSGGAVTIDSVTEEITSHFDVSSSSVVAYASSSPFQLRDGKVKRSAGEQPRKNASETRRLYKFEHGWKYRFAVTSDHLRGSGFPIPRGVADLVSCQPGQGVELAAPLGPIVLRRTGLQPACGSIRAELEALQAKPGDSAFLAIDPEKRTALIELAVGQEGESNVESIRRLVGLPRVGDNERLFSDLARALDLPEGSDKTSVAAALRDRGEHDLFEKIALLNSGSLKASVPELPGTGKPAKARTNDQILELLGLG